MAELVRCLTCGASLRADAQWCGQCSTVIPQVPDEEPSLRRSLPEQAALAKPQHYSRWRKSETSFGPVGRILITLFMVGVGALFAWSRDIFAIIPWWGIAVPLVLRSVWAKKRVT